VIPWFEYVHIAVAIAAGLFCIGMGLGGRKPNDFTLGAVALVELFMIAMLVIALISPAFGNMPTGSGLEFWVYLVSAVLLPPVAAIWALVDRSRWSTVVLGVACLAIAVMVYRMGQIWFVQVA
jgi:hypothetical protein